VIRINLLPHREEKRKARRDQFYALMGFAAIVGAVIVLLVHSVFAGYISAQEGKNAFLTKEIAALDKELDEIKRLKEQTSDLLARKQVIESLQANRNEAVSLFNELARQVPEGTYLKSLKQTGEKINLVGYAQSSARVSTLMRNLEASPQLERPDLVEVKAAIVGSRRLSEFNLNVAITRAKPEEPKKAGVKPAGAAAK